MGNEKRKIRDDLGLINIFGEYGRTALYNAPFPFSTSTQLQTHLISLPTVGHPSTPNAPHLPPTPQCSEPEGQNSKNDLRGGRITVDLLQINEQPRTRSWFPPRLSILVILKSASHWQRRLWRRGARTCVWGRKHLYNGVCLFNH